MRETLLFQKYTKILSKTNHVFFIRNISYRSKFFCRNVKEFVLVKKNNIQEISQHGLERNVLAG